jgi:hypothetical protein
MKKIFSIALTMIALSAKAQDSIHSELPKGIFVDFSQKFPDLSKDDVVWETDDFSYKAQFDKQHLTFEVIYDKSEAWVYTKTKKLTKDDLPTNLRSNISNRKEDFDFEDIIDMEMRVSKEGTLYKIEARTGDGDSDYYYDDEGNRIG